MGGVLACTIGWKSNSAYRDKFINKKLQTFAKQHGLQEQNINHGRYTPGYTHFVCGGSGLGLLWHNRKTIESRCEAFKKEAVEYLFRVHRISDVKESIDFLPP